MRNRAGSARSRTSTPPPSNADSDEEPRSPTATPTAVAAGAGAGGATRGLTAAETKAAESKLSKMVTRLAFGVPMILGFFVVVWLGHPYLVALVGLIQVGLFRELVNVRYQPAKEMHVPLFRTIQWSMFGVAMMFVYSRSFVKLGLAQSALRLLPAAWQGSAREALRLKSFVPFACYIAVFMGFVLSLKKGLYKYQIGNFVWTVGVLTLTVWQIQGTTNLIFAGLVWFILPCSLVVANDCFAYFCGMACGRRFIKAPFLEISPNKTWEGFIGAMICTMAFSWPWADWISSSAWFVCPQPEFEPFGTLDCSPGQIFVPRQLELPSPDLPLLRVVAKPFQAHAVLLALFASVVAPFGGFLASAIKRAYGIKDFDSLIPGHGGFMDRMDCQFLMLLCTYVHYNTFIRETFYTEAQIVGIVASLPSDAREQLLRRLNSEFAAR
eukprot:TRINITY_DN14869_c0_g3_i2.p1 TRINITY_DN14869_c0_g3~~TRINITY_DN14869_c0_g3_i2.p1  ORF type:complete len:439 (-),score=96.37 TRINITY_DN14869_c0_g3_i2:58-1374(-)